MSSDIPEIPGGLSAAEFDELIDRFIEREDPHAISLDVLAELDAQNQLELPHETPLNTFEFLGKFEGQQLKLFPLVKSSTMEVADNEIRFPNGWRVVALPPSAVAN